MHQKTRPKKSSSEIPFKEIENWLNCTQKPWFFERLPIYSKIYSFIPSFLNLQKKLPNFEVGLQTK